MTRRRTRVEEAHLRQKNSAAFLDTAVHPNTERIQRTRTHQLCDEVVCHTDFFATLASIAGAELPADAAPDSYDFLSVLEGAERDEPLREATVLHSIWGMFAIRQGRWKLCFGLGSGGWTEPDFIEPQEDGPIGQLYDLVEDPGEENNVFLEHPDLVDELLELLQAYYESGRSVPERDT